MFRLNMKKENPTKQVEKRAGKNQPDFMDAKPEGIDFAAPSIIKETLPNEFSTEGVKLNDYVVEVGGTVVPARYYRSFFAEIAGGTTWGGMLDELVLGQFGERDMDLAIHVRPAANDRELDETGRRINGLLSDLASEKNPSRADAMKDEIADLKKRQKRIRMNMERSFRVTIQVVASGRKWQEFKKYTNALVRRFAGKSIILRAADGNQLEALQAILPTARPVNIIKEHFLSLETSNLADLFPFGQGGVSHRTGIIIGVDPLGRPVWFDNWHQSMTNQHMVIIGRSGAGKTYTVMTIAHRLVHTGKRGAIVDWKGEYKEKLLLLGCPYLELSEKSLDRINPYDLEVSADLDGTRYVDIEEAANGVQALVFKMISTYDRTVLTGEVKVYIGSAIREQYREAGITRDPTSLKDMAGQDHKFVVGGKDRDMPVLSGLYDKMAKSDKEAVKRAAELLKPFTVYGNAPSYAIFDGQSTVKLQTAPLFGFAINKLDKDIMRPIGLFAVTRWLSEKFAKGDVRQQKFIVVEECQNIMDDPDTGAAWAESSYREGRSKYVHVCGYPGSGSVQPFSSRNCRHQDQPN